MIKVNGKEVIFKAFPNGETRLVKESLPEYGWVIDKVSFKYENDSDLIKLMLLKNFMDEFYGGYASRAELQIYYMPYSRMDRSENQSPFTLKYVSNFINNLNFDKITIVEPHSDVTPALINNCTSKYINYDLVKYVKDEIGFDEDNDYVVFPDAGASKRYSKMKVKNMLFCNKVRDFETGEIKDLDLVGDTSRAYGKMALIVDDLSSYGGTFVHTSKRLREEGFVEVNLLVAHAENSIFKGELFKHIDKVFTTDSILTDHGLEENLKYGNRLKIYNIEGVLA